MNKFVKMKATFICILITHNAKHFANKYTNKDLLVTLIINTVHANKQWHNCQTTFTPCHMATCL